LKFSNKKPKITSLLDYQITQLQKEFDYILFCERVKNSYKEPKKPNNYK